MPERDETDAEAETIGVFFTGGGGGGTIEILRQLRETGRYRLIAVDASAASVGFAFADVCGTVPFGASDEFVPALRDWLQRTRPRFVVPLVDEEIPKVHRLIDAEFPEMTVLAPKLEFCESMMDKWKMFERLSEANISVAATWLASDALAATYPAIIKPRSGRGSRGLAFLDDPGDLQAYLEKTTLPADRFIVQQRIFGREYTTSAVVTLEGRILSIVPKEAAEKRGITIVGITRQSASIDALCRSVQERLGADGPFNVQLIVDEAGKPHVIEINPRYSTTVALTLAAGVDEVDLVIRSAMGERVDAPAFQPGLMMIRYNAQHYVHESDWPPSAG